MCLCGSLGVSFFFFGCLFSGATLQGSPVDLAKKKGFTDTLNAMLKAADEYKDAPKK
jgi:hypothetical protein